MFNESKESETGKFTQLEVNLPQAGNQKEPEIIDITPKKIERLPQAADLAAKDWGVSGKAVRDAKTIIEDGTDDEKEAVKKGEKSVSSTARKIREVKKKEPEIKPPIPKKMNFTNDNIEWAKWSWNPVTGCNHGCLYCYARDIANRFDGNFDPKYHQDRLSAPANTKIPEKNKDEIGINNVFVCSMADLFGDWVPTEWIQNVIDVCEKENQWNYLFLTKNPKRYLEFAFPSNCWLGASADTQARANNAMDTFNRLSGKNIRFLSCEPLMEPLNLGTGIANIDWIIIGGRSKSTGMPAGQPEWGWVENLLFQVRNLQSNSKVYFKPNLTVRPKEYPI